MSDQPTQNNASSTQPADKKKGFSIKLAILLIMMTLISMSGGVEIYHAIQTGQPVNWEIMEKVLDRLVTVLSSSDDT